MANPSNAANSRAQNSADPMAGSGHDAIVGIWVKWRFDRLGSRGARKNIFGMEKRGQPFELPSGTKMTPDECCSAGSWRK
jgi:hypothetical protein